MMKNNITLAAEWIRAASNDIICRMDSELKDFTAPEFNALVDSHLRSIKLVPLWILTPGQSRSDVSDQVASYQSRSIADAMLSDARLKFHEGVDEDYVCSSQGFRLASTLSQTERYVNLYDNIYKEMYIWYNNRSRGSRPLEPEFTMAAEKYLLGKPGKLNSVSEKRRPVLANNIIKELCRDLSVKPVENQATTSSACENYTHALTEVLKRLYPHYSGESQIRG